MNKMKKMALLLLLAAASNSATAQNEVIRLQAGQAFTLHSKAEAVGTGLPPKYQWYRDGSPIEGATSPDYTIPAGQAVGSNVEFKRAAYTDGCAERMFTNTISITWCNLLLNGVCWADANVAQPGTFAARPDMYTEFYQWNQPAVPWPATGELPAGTTWTTFGTITASAWTSTPCPEGWRLPTAAEHARLDEVSGGSGTNDAPHGGTWSAAGSATKNNAIEGRFYGPNHATCTLPGNMAGCVFLPAAGTRNSSTGALGNYGFGYYWSSTQDTTTNGLNLRFGSTDSFPARSSSKTSGITIRCVQ